MNRSSSFKTLSRVVCCVALCAAPSVAVDSALGGGGRAAAPVVSLDAPLAGVNWIDHFDTYVTGSQMHLQGGWKGWDSSPAAGALTSSTQARSPLNSVDVLAGTDLVHEYTGYTTGTWTYTAWQYIPTGMTGNQYFILLNTYADAGTNNWSTQVCFNSVAGTVVDDIPGDCSTAGTVSIVFDQWVELRVVIDLDANTQTFFYNGQLVYSDTWTEHISGGGVANIAAVDLFANGSTSVFYDDISLSNMPFLDGFENESTSEWHSTVP